MRRGDTIAAIATARGQSALAVIRVSGPDALDIAARCFDGVDLRQVGANTATFGRIVTPGQTRPSDRGAGTTRSPRRFAPRDDDRGDDRGDGTTRSPRRFAPRDDDCDDDRGDDCYVDQVVATVFRAPRSATGEDVVEVSCHGGDVAARLVLQALLDGGARLAEPGEFTQRAFLNGKLDLAQAEAVADLIHASSTAAHRVSVSHLEGRYSERLADIRNELLELAALVELELDFSEEDVEFADKPRLEQLLQRSRDYVAGLLGSYGVGTMIRDGVRVVIAGRPNAGKSTLLNALVGRDRAIVSATPGTTRDEIESDAEIGGVRFVFTDTAGLREAADEIEAEGVRRAEAAVGRADLLLYVYDVTVGLAAEESDWLRREATARDPRAGSSGLASPVGAPPVATPPVLLVANKADLLQAAAPAATEGPAGIRHVRVSALAARANESALGPVADWLGEQTAGRLSDYDASAIVTNERHRRHLGAAATALKEASRTLASGGTGEVLSVDLRVALQELGAITGEITTEDVLGEIFGRFCIGK